MRKAYAELMSTKCKYDDSTQGLSDMKQFLFDNGAYSLCFTFVICCFDFHCDFFIVITFFYLRFIYIYYLFMFVICLQLMY